MANAPDPLVGKTLADRFEIMERIGEGGTGVVYKAKQLSVDRVIAIKVLGAHVSTDPSWVKRFHNEARAASRLDHPNTVRLIDFGQTKEGLLFIAMEYLSGRSLRAEIDQRQRLPPNRVLRIVSQMCMSLGEAHRQGIIHRDIKPDNVYLTDMKGAGDFVKVLDFSVAKLDAPDAQVTRAGVVFGTPSYMSPEQGRGVPLDARSDIYAVGIVAYEMLTGKPPFDHKIPTEVVMMHLREQPAPLTSAPPPVARIVMRALEKDPARRQQTADELNQECQACMAELFPRQTPMSGINNVLSPSAGVPAAPPMGAPPPAATAPTALPTPSPVVQAAGPASELKTMMAGEAPVIVPPRGAPPPAAAQPSRPISAGPPMASSGPPPMASSGPPPPAGNYGPPPVVGAPPIAEQKTMMAGMPAPVMPSSSPSNQKTMAVSAPVAGGIPTAGTQIIPDSQGVVAYARDRAAAARESAGPDTLPAQPAGALFWLAWIIVGIGAGLGIHFWLAHRAATGS